MGTAGFAVPTLDAISMTTHEILLVVTRPDRPRGRGQNVSFTPVKQHAVLKNYPILQPEDLKDENFLQRLIAIKPDLCVVVAYRILPPEIFGIPKLGSVNLHASLLPKYRGAAPINWAIIRGEKETGVTTFFIQEKVDTGNVILQKQTAIGEDENAGEVHDRLAAMGAAAMVETLTVISENRVVLLRQDEALSTTAPKIFKATCKINWNQTAEEIRNFVRGLSPQPGAWCELGEEVYKIYRVQVLSVTNGEPGSFVEIEKGKRLGVIAGDRKIIEILELQPPSKRRMTASEFLRGYKFGIK